MIMEIKGEKVLESIIVDNNREIAVSGLFIAIADVPETGYLLNGMNVNETGNVIADETLLTNKEGIYVAGDIRVKTLRQVATAVSDGAIAATQAIKYINGKKWN